MYTTTVDCSDFDTFKSKMYTTYDTIRYIYVRSKADAMASLI